MGKKMINFEDIIIYEDNHLLVINKPSGVLSQEDSSGDLDVLSWAKTFIKKREHKPGNVYIGLVHRLDRNTAGLMCLAKTSKAAARLSEQIRNKTWTKGYLTLSLAHKKQAPDTEWQLWLDHLDKDGETNKSMLVNKTSKPKIKHNVKGKAAILNTKLLAQKIIDNELINLRTHELVTGRSHQIRVQMHARDESIIGDFKYGAKKIRGLSKFYLGLFAYKLQIEHPTRKESMTFTAKPNDKFFWEFFNDEISELL